MTISHWFTAVVENINDPLNAGRVQIRCYDYHSQDLQMIPSKDLPWAMPIMPLTSAAQGGVGVSATGLQVGTWVFGFFRDEDLQDPVLLGSVPGVINSSGAQSIPGGAGSATAGAAPGYGTAMTGSQMMSGVPGAVPGDLSSLQNPTAPIQVSGDVANRLISIGKNELGVVETSNNQGAGIEKYWSATSYPGGYRDRQPWCAAFTSWVVKTAGVLPDNMLPNSASAFGYNAWAEGKARSVTQLRYNPREVLPGDLVVFNFSHIGIATSRSEGGKFHTIEGNTNAAGAREGNGVYEKVRTLSLLKSAITITASPTGAAPALAANGATPAATTPTATA